MIAAKRGEWKFQMGRFLNNPKSQTRMAIRFRRKIKILPGVHFNISKSGISTSIGVRGASVTLGKRGTYTNVGIPGSGIYMRSRVHKQPTGDAVPRTHAEVPVSEAAPAMAASPTVPFHSHHLHWWKVLLFFALMIAAGATKSNPIIGAFWFASFAYWFFLLVRLAVRKSRA